MDCLKLFVKEEQLGKDDPWYCSDCQDFRQAFKKFDIWTAPPILIIHMKRFAYRHTFREKIEQFIDFPLEDLDLSEFVIGPKAAPPIYDLYAVSNHMGNISRGHYIAYARHRDDGKWYCYDDDQQVKEVSSNSVRSATAYVLFYKRKDVPWNPFDKTLDKLATEQLEEELEDEDSDSDETPAAANNNEVRENQSMAIVLVPEENVNNNRPSNSEQINDTNTLTGTVVSHVTEAISQADIHQTSAPF